LGLGFFVERIEEVVVVEMKWERKGDESLSAVA
jgi:hypothetical protein